MKHVLLLMILSSQSLLYSQNSNNAYFLTGGISIPLFPKGVGNCSGVFIKGNNLFSLGFLGGAKLTDEASVRYKEFSLMYGRAYSGDKFRFYVSGGVCRASGTWEDSDERGHKYNIVGVPVEAQFIIVPIKIAGIGIKVTKTFRKHDYGPYFMVTLNLGKI